MKQKVRPTLLAKFMLLVLVFMVSLVGCFFSLSYTNFNNLGKWVISIPVAIIVVFIFVMIQKLNKDEQEVEHFKGPHFK